jgi:hypothetical protein
MTKSPEFGYTKAKFIAYEPRGYDAKPPRMREIPFKINPESLSRSVTVEAAKTGGGVEGAAQKAPAGKAGDTKADAAAGALKETFSIKIRLDFAEDRGEAAARPEDVLGVAPEIAAIEDLLHPVETEQDKVKKTGSQRATSPRPTVLLAWGAHSVIPVRIASLKIEESVYNAELYPVRAEIEATLEVLGAAEAANHAGVAARLKDRNAARRELAAKFYARTGTAGRTPQN